VQPPIRVCLVEDDRRFREELGALLGTVRGLVWAGGWGSAEAAQEGLAEAQPDVVLLDIHLPGRSGVDFVATLRQRMPSVVILMLTAYEDAELIFGALQRGAQGYLLKRTPPAKLVEAIQDAHGGGAPMSPQIARKVVQYFQQPAASDPGLASLTPREREVLDELAKGCLYKEIADRLGISVETVRGYLSAIYAKLHVRTRTEAVVRYLGRR
jgi:DNA-binding NarL/FixJ family response regulator